MEDNLHRHLVGKHHSQVEAAGDGQVEAAEDGQGEHRGWQKEDCNQGNLYYSSKATTG